MRLESAGFINKDGTVVSYCRMNPAIRDRYMTEVEAKQLIVIELGRADGIAPREDLIARLINYLTTIDKEKTKEKIKTFLNNHGR